jgi:hypothetical protein
LLSLTRCRKYRESTADVERRRETMGDVAQPGERAGVPGIVDQMYCAHNVPDRVYEAARLCAFAFPSADVDHIADRVASYYGYTDPEARAVFVRYVASYLWRNRA